MVLQGTIVCPSYMKKENIDSFTLLRTFNKVESYHWWWEGRRYLIKQLLDGEDLKKILDIGCGTGETLTFLKTLFPNAELYGVDTSDDSVSYSQKRGHKNVVSADANKLPYKHGKFDVVHFLDVLEHIEDDAKALLEAKRVLSEGGKIIITSPAMPFLWSDHDKNQGHFRRYTKEDIMLLSKKTGLKIEYLGYFNFFLSPIIIFVRLFGKLPYLHFIVQYDNGINYTIAYHPFINKTLAAIFKLEIWFFMKGIRYPFGISLVAQLTN